MTIEILLLIIVIVYVAFVMLSVFAFGNYIEKQEELMTGNDKNHDK